MHVCVSFLCMYVCMYCICAKLLLPKSSRIGTGITPLTIHFPSSLHHKIVRSALSLLIHIHTYICLLLLDGHLLRSEEETRCRHHSNAKVTRLIALLPQHRHKVTLYKHTCIHKCKIALGYGCMNILPEVKLEVDAAELVADLYTPVHGIGRKFLTW